MRIMSDVPVGPRPTCSFEKSGGVSAGRCFSCCQNFGLLTVSAATPPSVGHGQVEARYHLHHLWRRLSSRLEKDEKLNLFDTFVSEHRITFDHSALISKKDQI